MILRIILYNNKKGEQIGLKIAERFSLFLLVFSFYPSEASMSDTILGDSIIKQTVTERYKRQSKMV